MALSFDEARRRVVETVTRARDAGPRAAEVVAIGEAAGRILAEDVAVDRDQPPFHRSTRDGFAVRSADVATTPARVRVIGEAAAGAAFAGGVAAGECVEIMTGAPLPDGADAVVMVEHTSRDGDAVVVKRAAAAGDNWVAAGSEARAGDPAVARGTRLDAAAIAMLASVGRARPAVYARPRVAILPTGAEIVGVGETPGPAQIRNSNAQSLAAQVERAGGIAVHMGIARDEAGHLRERVEAAIAGCDALVLSGGVSMGKYDLVEQVLRGLGARFEFHGVDLRPGKPVAFGELEGKPFFGLPGNPLSTAVTFELFARPAVELLAGAASAPLRLGAARLAAAFEQRALPLTVFAPARLEEGAAGGIPTATPLGSQGSGDLAAWVRADGWIVVAPGVTSIPAGELVALLPK